MSMVPSPEVAVVLTTAPDTVTAERMAGRLLEEGLIACANVVPGVRSVYRWEGETRNDNEVLMLLKTTSETARALTERISELHPYDVPEVLALPASAGLDSYVAWVGREVRGGHG